MIQVQYPMSPATDSVGVEVSADAPVDVLIRNSMVIFGGSGSGANHTGILIGDPDVQLFAVSNTLIGGAYGIKALAGIATVTNNLVADVDEACYEGDFTSQSTGNLASDETAPGPPPSHIGAVTVSYSPDPRLDCRMAAQEFTAVGDFAPDAIERIFDGDPVTLAVSPSINPARLLIEFAEPRTIIGASLMVSHFSSHSWTMGTADTLEDLESQSGSYRELVPRDDLDNPFSAWGSATFDEPVTGRLFGITVSRNGGDDFVHVNEVRLDGANPACGQGENLSEHPEHAFGIDVDSLARPARWDIGADQHDWLTVGFAPAPTSEWWESEGGAQFQLVLSEPAPTAITIRYDTETFSGSATPGEDYLPIRGTLEFAPGEVSKIVDVPLIDDGPGDEWETVFLSLTSAQGAVIDLSESEVVLREGPPLPRVSIANPIIEVVEGTGEALITISLSEPVNDIVTGALTAIEGSALPSADYSGSPWYPSGTHVNFAIEPGETSVAVRFSITDDWWKEPPEGFTVFINRVSEVARLGAPSAAYVRILDDDGVAP